MLLLIEPLKVVISFWIGLLLAQYALSCADLIVILGDNSDWRRGGGGEGGEEGCCSIGFSKDCLDPSRILQIGIARI